MNIEIYDKALLKKYNKHPWDYADKGITPKIDGIEPLITTSKIINVGDIVEINGKIYVIGILSNKCGNDIAAYASLLQKQAVFAENEKPKNILNALHITCPFCGHEDNESYNCEDSCDNYTCENCGSSFEYEREVIVTYNMVPKYRSPLVKL